MWEYDRVEIKHKSINEMLKELNRLGAENWEVFHYMEHKPEKFGGDYTTIVLLKRIKPA